MTGMKSKRITLPTGAEYACLDLIQAPKDADLGSTNDSRLVVIATTMALHGPTGVNSHMRACATAWDDNHIPWAIASPWCVGGFWRLVRGVFWRIEGHLPLFVRFRISQGFWLRLLKRDLTRATKLVCTDTGTKLAVYAQSPLALIAAVQAISDPKMARKVLVCHFNGSEKSEFCVKFGLTPEDPFCRILDQVESNALSFADKVVVPSQWLAAILAARHPANASKIVVIPNGVADPVESETTVRDKRWDFICVGTLEPRKNQRYLLEIMRHCRLRGRPIKVAFVGDGDDRVMLERDSLVLEVAEDVTFLGRQANAHRFMPNARGLIHVAIMETFGIVLIEALAHGLPIFACPVGGIPEIVSSGRNGRFIPLDDADQAAAILLESIDDGPRMAAMSSEARQNFLARFNITAVMAQLNAVLWPSHE